MKPSSKLNVLKAAVVALVGGMFAVNSHAGTSTSNMAVSATVAANCSISANALSFGVYDTVSAAAVDGTATVSTTCTSGSAATVTLGQGANADTGSTDDVPLRRMTDGGTNFMTYSLYQDAGKATVWGNTAGTGVGVTGSGSAETLTVYGSIAAGQNTLPVGTYNDTVVATVTF